MESKNNYTHHVDSKNVKIWSNIRFPLFGVYHKTNPWLNNLRTQIRQDLSHLKLGREDILYASYVSLKKGFFDVENVLFYNIGTKHFDNLTRNGLMFERGIIEPPKIDKFIFPHFQQYSIEKSSFSYWEHENELATFSSAPLKISYWFDSPKTRVDDIWFSLKRGNIKSLDSAEVPQYFGLNIEVKCNKKTIISRSLKVWLDGIVAAFQFHLNGDEPSLFDETSKRLGIDSEKVKELLLDKKNAVLGSAKLISKFQQTSIKWNPKDDGLVAVKIIPKYSDLEYTTFSGKIYSVKTPDSEDN